MTHADLVVRAGRWLRRQRCGVVLLEHYGGGTEIPDAVGWRHWHSILVECKTDRGDFRRDMRKRTRHSYEMRPADECYYMTPPGLLTLDDRGLLSEMGWGLLLALPHVVMTMKEPRRPAGERDRSEMLRRDIARLYAELRRYQSQGITYKKFAELQEAERR